MNPYEILGVEKGATADEIKKAYRKLAHQHHPDKGGGDEAKFKEINGAYQILSDEKKRAQYDQFGASFDGAGGQGYGGFEDMFRGGGVGGNTRGFNVDIGDIFEDFFAGQSGRGAQAAGRDIGLDIEISLEQVMTGLEHTANLDRLIVCEHCKGDGAEPDAGLEECSTCSGSGQVQQQQQTFFGAFSRVHPCRECNGRGKIPKKKCAQCKGEGRIRKGEDVSIVVPPGIDDGAAIRLEGKGEAGAHGAPAGNLYVTVHVKEHERFKRRGKDLYTDIHVPFSTVVLGGKTKVKLLGEDETTLKIPKTTPSGKVLRVRGKGLPSVGGGSFGALYVTIEVEVPDRLSREQKTLLESLQSENL